MSATKKLQSYVTERVEKQSIPARVPKEVIIRAQHAARALKIPLTAFVEAALSMACDQAEKTKS